MTMGCFHPLRGYRAKTPNSNGKYPLVVQPRKGQTDCPIEVPCGQCIGCRLERSRQWAIRCTHELSLYPRNSFLTLTYKPEELPLHGSLNKRHLQLFWKRYRKWLGSHKIRYLACGEYGEQNNRPHYHAIVFNHDFSDKKPHGPKIGGNQYYTSEKLEELWTHGHCIIGEANFETAAYVARYVTKKINGPMAEDHYNTINKETGEVLSERIPEFISPSRNPGIGAEWYRKYHKEVYGRDEVLIRGKLMQPPKFYDRLHLLHDPDRHEEVQHSRMIAALKNPDNNYERRQVLEAIAKINNSNLKRNFEK